MHLCSPAFLLDFTECLSFPLHLIFKSVFLNFFYSMWQPCKGGISISISHLRKPRLIQDHIAIKWQSRNSHPESSHSSYPFFPWPQNASPFWNLLSVNFWAWAQWSLRFFQILRFSSHAVTLLIEMRLGAGPVGSDCSWETCYETW